MSQEATIENHGTGRGRPPRILIVVEPGLDGVFRHVEGLVSYLLERSVEVHLVYSTRRCGAAMLALVDRVSASGGEVMDLRVSNFPTLADLVAIYRLVAFVRRVRPDVIHAHSSKAGVLGRTASILTGCPRCLYSPQAYYGMAKPPWLKVRFFNWIEAIFGRYGTTIAISRDEADFARTVLGINEARISVIPNPVDSNRFRPPTPQQRREARMKFGIPENAVVLATVGRMCWQKDPETAYAGVAPVCKENSNLLFFHLGWGKWREYLLGLGQTLELGAHLRILDYTDNPCDFYHAIDALVISSRYEAGWSLVFLEAMACNLPIVSATCVGMSDIGRAGLSHVWTFDPEDVAGCTRAIRQWLSSHRGENGVTGCNHREFVVERLSPERCYGAIFGLYLEVPKEAGVLKHG